MGCKFKDRCPSYSGWCEGIDYPDENCISYILDAYENEKKKTEDLEWIYHIPEKNYGIVDFDSVEKALGFRLFGWQKDYIITGCAYGNRRTGKTTAEILHQLFSVDEEPIDFSKPAPIKRIAIIRQYYRDIWEKLHDAGIPMRLVFWSKEDKKKYNAEHYDPYKYAREAFDKYEIEHHNYKCSDCSQCRYSNTYNVHYCRRSSMTIYEPEEISSCDEFEKGD